MADSSAVPPVVGNAAPAAPGPAPIPRRLARFRQANVGQQAITAYTPEYPISEGIPPMIAHADGYASVEVQQTGLNTFIPSYINVAGRVFLTNQRLCANDKFLKEQAFYHPDALDLYISFLFIYHSLRVRAEVGSLSVAEDTLLSNLRANYPETSLPIPGTVIECFQSITTTENPYSWQGNITTAVPANNEYQAGLQAYLLNNNLHLIYPCPAMLVSQVNAAAGYARVANNVDHTVEDLLANRFSLANARILTTDPERFWLSTPHGRFPPVANDRVIRAFRGSVNGLNAAPFMNRFVLDLPTLNNNASTANMSLASYLGVIDAEGVANRRMNFLRWPVQLASMAAAACKYISGSRPLSKINTTGLGANSIINRYSPTVVLENRDPAVLPGQGAGVLNTYAAFNVISLNAHLRIRDPVINDLAVQYAMLAQINVNLEDCIDNAGTPLGQIVASRLGEFWDYPICEYGPEAAVANILFSHLPNYVRSNPRRDGSD